MSNYLGHIDDGVNITIITDTDTLLVGPDHLNIDEVRFYLEQGDYEEALECADVSQKINNWTGVSGLEYVDGSLFYKGVEIDNALADRIIKMINNDDDPVALCAFLKNMMDNPSGRAVKELYRFLQANTLPITPDGHFLAYKNVRSDYMDKYSGKFRNMVGDVCEMPRNQVMDDPNQTCSAGLHFCSLHYLRSMWGFSGHTMIVKINPRDVVSIPVDYENSKGRCCRYEVVAEHKSGQEDFYDDDVTVWESDWDEDYWSDEPDF